MNPNLDFGEVYVTVKNNLTSKPYVDSAGRTTMNMKYLSCSWEPTMYEPKGHQLSTAQITLQSLMGSDDLRALYSQILEGDRVEIYGFQPDCGDPVFAGYIPQNGLSEENGSLILDVQDPLLQGKWQHLQQMEENSTTLNNWYSRAFSRWRDYLNEDFASDKMPANYATSIITHSPSFSWTKNVGLKCVSGNGNSNLNDIGAFTATYLNSTSTGIPFGQGDTILIDLWVTFYQPGNMVAVGDGSNWGQNAALLAALKGVGDSTEFDWSWTYITPASNPMITVPTQYSEYIIQAWSSDGTPIENYSPAAQGGPNSFGGTWVSEVTPVTHRMTFMLKSDPDVAGRYTMALAIDGQPFNSQTFNSSKSLAPILYPQIQFNMSGAAPYVILNKLRVRKLTTYLTKSAHFVPQTSSPIYFQPNNEDMTSFLDFLAENDNTEFRPIFKAAPIEDEIELDGIGKLGINASAQLLYDNLTPPGAPFASPTGVGTETANFLYAPPFRFEEGWNLSAPPRREPKQIVHVNEILKMGAGQAASQLQASAWAAQEVGNPGAGIAQVYPIFEGLSDDDRAATILVVQDLAQLEQARAVDPTPSLTLQVVSDLQSAFKWREGDTVWVKTQSLINNVEQLMRIMRIRHEAGSALKEVTLGRIAWDAALQQLMTKNMIINWLYDQNAQFGTSLAYPYVGLIAANGTSGNWTFPLDTFTTGSAIISAELRWFSAQGQPVSDLSAWLNSSHVTTVASGQDSGSIDVTAILSQPQIYSLYFANGNGSLGRTLQSAFLTVRLRI